ncbi:hypothetical protein ACJX0J_021857 [Zea mays]
MVKMPHALIFMLPDILYLIFPLFQIISHFFYSLLYLKQTYQWDFKTVYMMIMRNFISNAWSKINNIVCIKCRPFLECNHPITFSHTREEAIPTCHGRGGGDGMRLTGAWTPSPIPPVVADILVQGQSTNEWGGIEFRLPFGRVYNSMRNTGSTCLFFCATLHVILHLVAIDDDFWKVFEIQIITGIAGFNFAPVGLILKTSIIITAHV